jgi:hypothetical protein
LRRNGSVATYTEVTQQQVEKVLLKRGFSRVSLPGVKEIVYGKRVDKDGIPLTIRVYSSIEESDGVSRGCGTDAIRVCLMWRYQPHDQVEPVITTVGSSKRVNRVPGWDFRLISRVQYWEEMLGPTCNRCNAPMAMRLGRRQKFWGCARYPTCKATQEIV